MPTKKKETPRTVTENDINNIWSVIDEMQLNLNMINDKLKRISSRVGV